jgi:hypothetical protein
MLTKIDWAGKAFDGNHAKNSPYSATSWAGISGIALPMPLASPVMIASSSGQG